MNPFCGLKTRKTEIFIGEIMVHPMETGKSQHAVHTGSEIHRHLKNEDSRQTQDGQVVLALPCRTSVPLGAGSWPATRASRC